MRFSAAWLAEARDGSQGLTGGWNHPRGGRRRLRWLGRGPGGDPWVRGGGGGREGVGEEEDESGDDGSDGGGRLPGRMPWPQRPWLAVRWMTV
jgi:hypothetical protein